MTEEQTQAVTNKVDDTNWASLLSQHKETFEKASRTSGSGWMPPASPDGIQYHCTLSGLRKGKTKDGIPYWGLSGTLMDGQDPETGESLEGKEFDIQFFSLASEQKAGFLKDWASALYGDTTVNDIEVADTVLTQAVESNTVVAVTVKQKGEWVNVYLDEVIESDLASSDDA
jgi:hypothetical protein